MSMVTVNKFWINAKTVDFPERKQTAPWSWLLFRNFHGIIAT